MSHNCGSNQCFTVTLWLNTEEVSSSPPDLRSHLAQKLALRITYLTITRTAARLLEMDVLLVNQPQTLMMNASTGIREKLVSVILMLRSLAYLSFCQNSELALPRDPVPKRSLKFAMYPTKILTDGPTGSSKTSLTWLRLPGTAPRVSIILMALYKTGKLRLSLALIYNSLRVCSPNSTLILRQHSSMPLSLLTLLFKHQPWFI